MTTRIVHESSDYRLVEREGFSSYSELWDPYPLLFPYVERVLYKRRRLFGVPFGYKAVRRKRYALDVNVCIRANTLGYPGYDLNQVFSGDDLTSLPE